MTHTPYAGLRKTALCLLILLTGTPSLIRADLLGPSSNGTSFGVSQGTGIKITALAGEAAIGTATSATLTLTSGFLSLPLVNRGLINHPPVIISPDSVVVTKGTAFLYLAQAVDPDSTKPSFRFVNVSSWLTAGSEVVQGTAPATPGLDSFTVIADDGAGARDTLTVHIIIRDKNEKPIITSIKKDTTTEGSWYSYHLTATDPNGDKITFSVFDLPDSLQWNSTTSTIEGVVGEAINGQSKFIRLRADDGGLYDEQILSLYIKRINNPPVITSVPTASILEHAQFRYLPAARDPESAPISFTYSTPLPSWLAYYGDTLKGIPPEGAKDTVFRFIASDGSLTDTQQVSVHVIPVDDPPVILSAPVVIGDRLPAGQTISYTAAAVDPEGQSVTLSIVNVPSWLTLSGNSVSGPITSTSPDSSGFTVIATETGGLHQAETLNVTVRVQDRNFPPRITSPATAIASPGKYFSYHATAVDTNGNRIGFTFNQVSSPWLKTADDSVYGTAPLSFQSASFNLTATDYRDSTTITVQIQRDTANNPPVIISKPDTIGIAGVLFQYRVRATDLDSAIDRVTFSLMTPPSGMQITADNGVITWTPTEAQTGKTTITVKATDSRGANVTQVFTLMIQPPALQVMRKTPAADVVIQPLECRTITITFNTALLDTASLDSLAIRIIGTSSIPLLYTRSFKDSTLTLTLQNVAEGLDTIAVTLGSRVRTKAGQTFATNEYQWNFRTTMPADFSLDGAVDEKDLPALVQNWKTRQTAEGVLPELGPASGIAPHLTVAPDRIFDFEDVSVFVQMWRWYLRSHSAPLAKSALRPASNPATAKVTVDIAIAQTAETESKLIVSCAARNLPSTVACRLRMFYPSNHLTLDANSVLPSMPQTTATDLLTITDFNDGSADLAMALLSNRVGYSQGQGLLSEYTLYGHPAIGDRIEIAYDLLAPDGTVIESGLARKVVEARDLPEEPPVVNKDNSTELQWVTAPNPCKPALMPSSFTMADRPQSLGIVAQAGNGCVFRFKAPKPGNAPTNDMPSAWIVIRSTATGELTAFTPKQALTAPADPSGYYTVRWDGFNTAGRRAAPGVYLVKLYLTLQGQTLSATTRVGVAW